MFLLKDFSIKKYIYLVLVLGLSLRLVNLASPALWLDELLSLTNASGLHTNTLPEAGEFFAPVVNNNLEATIKANRIDDGGNGVLHAVILHYWIDLFGISNLAVRLMEVVFYVLAFFAMLLFLQKRCSEIVVLVALVLFSLHPLLLEHNRELRTYSLAILVAILLSEYFFRLMESNRIKYLVIYFLLCVAAFLTHFLLPAIIVIHVAMLFIFYRNKSNMIKATVLGILFLGLLKIWYDTGGSEGLNHIAERDKIYVEKISEITQTTPTAIIRGWAEIFVPLTGNMFKHISFRNRESALLMIPQLVLLMMLVYHHRLKLFSTSNPFKWYLILCTSMPFLIATFLALKSGHTTPFLPRYAVWYVPFFVIGVAIAIEPFLKRTKLIFWLFGSWILILLVSSVIVILDLKLERKSNNELVEFVHQQHDKIETISYKSPRIAMYLNMQENLDEIVQTISKSQKQDVKILLNSGHVHIFEFDLANAGTEKPNE